MTVVPMIRSSNRTLSMVAFAVTLFVVVATALLLTRGTVTSADDRASRRPSQQQKQQWQPLKLQELVDNTNSSNSTTTTDDTVSDDTDNLDFGDNIKSNSTQGGGGWFNSTNDDENENMEDESICNANGTVVLQYANSVDAARHSIVYQPQCSSAEDTLVGSKLNKTSSDSDNGGGWFGMDNNNDATLTYNWTCANQCSTCFHNDNDRAVLLYCGHIESSDSLSLVVANVTAGGDITTTNNTNTNNMNKNNNSDTSNNNDGIFGNNNNLIIMDRSHRLRTFRPIPLALPTLLWRQEPCVFLLPTTFLTIPLVSVPFPTMV